MKIAGLSSKKLGDSYEGQLKNNYLYQGAYSELDDYIGWYDFYLRNYDAQIGRWVQQDPFQQFASSYVGMGGDPVNNTDPTGGLSWPPPGLEKIASVAAESVGKVLEVSGQSTKAISLLSKINIAIKVVGLTNKIINNAVPAKQAGRVYSTPNGGSITLPDRAKNLTFYDDKGVGYFLNNDGSSDLDNPFKVTPGSLKSFDFEGKHYDAMFYYSDASFAKYGWNQIHYDFGEITRVNHTLTIWSSVKIGKPDAAAAAQAGGITLRATTLTPAQIKYVSAAIAAVSAYVLSTVYWSYVTYDFGMTAPSHPFDGGYIYSKGGTQTIWPDDYGFPPNPKTIDWRKSDSELANELSKAFDDAVRGPKSSNNRAKKWFNGKRNKMKNK